MPSEWIGNGNYVWESNRRDGISKQMNPTIRADIFKADIFKADIFKQMSRYFLTDETLFSTQMSRYFQTDEQIFSNR